MIVKKYQAKSKTEAMLKVKKELGSEALIINIRTIKPKGFQKLFKKQSVEVTATVDDAKSKPNTNIETFNQVINETMKSVQKDEIGKVEEIEQRLNKLQNIIENKNEVEQDLNINKPIVKLIYNQLIENEVDENIVNDLLERINVDYKNNYDLDSVLTKVYQHIIIKLGQPKPIQLLEGQCKKIFFIGPTGVGKTTTIAKIASHFVINKNKKVGLITADTYRIAAVEQLKTYANILCIPLKVIYSNDELDDAIKFYSDKDLILIDTAGRSHKNEEQFDDLIKLIQACDEKEVYLVLSLTTKYNDLLKITTKYKIATDYKIIFTKLDETSSLGNILNIKQLTGADLSYATTGQNVPDDIEELNPMKVAKQILGGNE